MYAIILSKTAGQSLWKNNKNIKFYRLILVLSHCQGTVNSSPKVLGKQSSHFTDSEQT